MDGRLRDAFMGKWENYFPKIGLPIGYYYTDEVLEEDRKDSKNETRCLIGNLAQVRDGGTFVYTQESPGCFGGKRFSGFPQTLRPNFEYFLSCGIPGKMEGERYKKSPDLVRQHQKNHQSYQAPGKYLVFKRWDRFREQETPVVIVFFVQPDVLSGLFTLANFDTPDPFGVVAPMGSGCASIIEYPLEQSRSDSPRCVMGMFDVSARPEVPVNALTFAVPLARFTQMVDNMDESFLITGSWKLVKSRF